MSAAIVLIRSKVHQEEDPGLQQLRICQEITFMWLPGFLRVIVKSSV